MNITHRLVAALLLAIASASCTPHYPAKETLEARSNKMWDRIGTELGKAAASQKPARILLIRQDNDATGSLGPGQDRMEAAIKKAVGSGAEIIISSLPVIPIPERETAESNYSPFHKLEPKTINAALAKNGTAPLLISLIGEPTSPPPSGANWPPVICFSRDGSTNLANLIQSGTVLAAVAPRHAEAPKKSTDWYDLRYTLLNKDNIGSW